jgi:hypothetical protein
MQHLSHMMETVDKVVFDCPQMVEAQGGGQTSSGAGGGRPGSQRESPYWLGFSRLRLNGSESRRHQAREARLWLLRRTGRDSMCRTTSQGADMEEMCVVCLTNPREALSISCGHKVMCLDCAARVKMINSSCPFCRVAMREVVLSKNRSTESVDSNGDAEMTGGADGNEVAAASAAAASTAPDNRVGDTDAAELVEAPAIDMAADEGVGASGDATGTMETEGSSGGSEGPGA